jgi:hypothetical protein
MTLSPPSKYGTSEISTITVQSTLDKSGLSKMDREIFILRYGYDWFYYEIGEYIGNKYRDKPYTEGAIRHRIKKIHDHLDRITKTW